MEFYMKATYYTINNYIFDNKPVKIMTSKYRMEAVEQ